LRRCDAQEPDGTWRPVTLYRDKKYASIVLWFSDNEYEGINTSDAQSGLGSGYRMSGELLFDDEGDRIHTRPIVVDKVAENVVVDDENEVVVVNIDEKDEGVF